MKKQFGKTPLCNGKPERAPHLGSFCFPLCWRCTALLVGYFLGSVLRFYWPLNMTWSTRFMLMLPLAFDGFFSYYTPWHRSNNVLRILTGLICGFGFS
ncbi:DUF2085 domain-containing protein [Jiulongibacter sediminis]|uniref:DUF2085 domain-containing protein n=1 Tax=Jiulongibacter sediminis TaxID=1605367 RepID=UPI0026F31D8B|nr:DUF2085 domain-containing protein [Jiulongibacter sediminis]